MRKQSLFAMAAGLVLALASQGAEAAEKIKIGFLPGVVDPFYQVMQLGVEKAAKDLGIDVVTQIPPTWGVEAQTPLLDAMVARGDLNYIITAPVDKDQMVGPLKAAVDARHQDHHRRHVPRRRRLRQRPGQVPDQLHRLRQRRGRPHRGARPRQGDRRQGHGLHQLDQPERQLGRGPREGLQGSDGEGIPRTSRCSARTTTSTTRTRRRSRPRRCWRANRTSPASSAPTCSAPRAPARRSSMPDSAARSRSSPTTRPSRRSNCMDKGVVTLVLAQKPFDMGYLAVEFAAGRRRRRHQPAAPRRDRLRDHRQGQREGPGGRPLHLSGAGQVGRPTTVVEGARERPRLRVPAHARRIRGRPRDRSRLEAVAEPRRRSGLRRVLTPAQRVALFLSRIWAWVFLGADGPVLRRRGAAVDRRLGQLPHHPQFAEHPGRDRPGAAARASARPSSSSPPASTCRSAG